MDIVTTLTPGIDTVVHISTLDLFESRKEDDLTEISTLDVMIPLANTSHVIVRKGPKLAAISIKVDRLHMSISMEAKFKHRITHWKCTYTRTNSTRKVKRSRPNPNKLRQRLLFNKIVARCCNTVKCNLDNADTQQRFLAQLRNEVIKVACNTRNKWLAKNMDVLMSEFTTSFLNAVNIRHLEKVGTFLHQVTSRPTYSTVNAQDLYDKYGDQALGMNVETLPANDWPGGHCKITDVMPDEEAPDILFQVELIDKTNLNPDQVDTIGILADEELICVLSDKVK